MTLPPNFSQAVDLSSLGKPPADTSTPMPGLEITPQNLQTEVLPLSEGKPVVILCWSPRSADSVTMLRALGTIESEDKGKWVLAHVNVEEQAPVAQALQVRTIPFGIVFIGGKAIPFLEQPLTEAQLREVIAKIFEGISNHEIAVKLNISRHTVATHRKNILFKSNCSDSQQLLLFCKKNGIIAQP